jgi:hypothetical protein
MLRSGTSRGRHCGMAREWQPAGRAHKLRAALLCALLAAGPLATAAMAIATSRQARAGSARSVVPWGAIKLPAHRIMGGPAILVGPRPLVRRGTLHAGPRAAVITRQPRGVSVPAGGLASFTSTASGTPPPAAQWQQSINGGRSWMKIRGAHSVTYALRANASENGYRFRVVFRNSRGRATSKAVMLTIASSSARPSAPRVTGQATSEAVSSGSVVAFTAAASGSPSPTVRWQLSIDGGRTWTDIAGATSTSYSFTAAWSETGYEYRAVFSNSAGSATTGAATLTVTSPPATQSPPQIVTQPADESVQSGATAGFTAAASGNPAPSVQWQASTDGGSSWSDIAGATSTSYSFTADSSETGSEYRAVFTNSSGRASSSGAVLTVTPAASAPVITTQPANKTVLVNGTASFTAAASGTPTPTVQWQVSGDGGTSWSSISAAASTTLTLTATSQQFYRYRAVFTNSAGTVASNPATLTIAQRSTNWSGYAVTGAGFSSASGSWIVPAVTCSGSTTYSSQWIGIDGWSNSTVEQDGTEADCISGSPYYGAWYEMYGDNAVNSGYEVPLSTSSYPVFPGDSMTASITVSASNWTLAISDTTQGWSDSIPITWSGSAQTSAEWIGERPGIGGGLAHLSNFTNISFTSASAADTGTSGPISSFAFDPIEMFNSSTLLAAPGPLDATGQSFGDTWYASS